jgi:hypothetical protein
MATGIGSMRPPIPDGVIAVAQIVDRLDESVKGVHVRDVTAR